MFTQIFPFLAYLSPRLLVSPSLSHSSTHSKISPGWQFNISQIASNVLNRMALAFPVFRIERFAGVIPTRSESSFKEILFFAISTSKFTIMGMIIGDLGSAKRRTSFGIYDLKIIWLGLVLPAFLCRLEKLEKQIQVYLLKMPKCVELKFLRLLYF